MAFAEYRGRCIGRLMHFLYAYIPKSDYAIFSDKKESPMITLFGQPFADYEWDGDTDIPTFTFLGEYKYLKEKQEREKLYLLRVEKMRKEWFGKEIDE